MIDREKVIKGLEHCSFGENRGCAGCPYNDECGDWGRDAGAGSLCTDALALLREQEPVKPVAQDAWPTPVKVCGSCGGYITYTAGRPRYCPNCGSEMKWDG